MARETVDLKPTIPAILLLVAGCGGGQPPATAGASPADTLLPPAIPLATERIAGQSIAVLPVTLVIADQSLRGGELFRNRDALLQWADSIIGERLAERAPEVEWKLPAELRQIARRSPGVVSDPDKMGQAVMRNPELEVIPDPFRGHLRSLVAVAGGRFAFVPAALVFRQPEPGRVKTEVILVLGDARSGQVLWRTISAAEGGAPDAALKTAMDAVLPLHGLEP